MLQIRIIEFVQGLMIARARPFIWKSTVFKIFWINYWGTSHSKHKLRNPCLEWLNSTLQKPCRVYSVNSRLLKPAFNCLNTRISCTSIKGPQMEALAAKRWSITSTLIGLKLGSCLGKREAPFENTCLTSMGAPPQLHKGWDWQIKCCFFNSCFYNIAGCWAPMAVCICES